MIAYISFAADTVREQELLSSDAIATYAYAYARSVIGQVPGLAYDRMLVGHEYRFLPRCADLAYSVMPPRPRYRSERERIFPQMQETAPWRIIIRPLQGRLSVRRLSTFCRQLAELDDHVEQVFSVAPYDSDAHPLWCTIGTDQHRRAGTSVRHSNLGVPDEVRGIANFSGKVDALRCGATGSQHVQTLYYDDKVLCAFRNTWDFESRGTVPPPMPLFTDPQEYRADLPPLFRLPLFAMSDDAAPELGNLERMAQHALERMQAEVPDGNGA